MDSIIETIVDLTTSGNFHNDPVFLTIFIILSYKRLTDDVLSITIGSTILSILISAACTQLAPRLGELWSQTHIPTFTHQPSSNDDAKFGN